MKYVIDPLVIFFLIIQSFIACTGCFGSEDNGGIKTPPAYTQTVGAAGASVVDPRGGQVIIPAGALAADAVISITTYNATDMARYLSISPFTSCIDLGPDGTVFSLPVTVTIPAGGITAGAAYPVYVLDEATGEWSEHSSAGTGSAGGDSIVFETDHFSTYAGAGSSGSGIRATINSSLTSNMDTAVAYDALQAAFEGMIGMQQVDGDKTYEVSGLYFDFQYSINGSDGQMRDLVGDMALKESKLNAYFDYRNYKGTGPLVDNQVIYEIQITIYWKEVEGNTWSGTMTYTEHSGCVLYYWDASYNVTFRFTYDPDKGISGTATATQSATVSGKDDNWVENINVPSAVNLIVYANIYEDDSIDLFFAISKEYPWTPFFTFDLYMPNDDGVETFSEDGVDMLPIYGYSGYSHFSPIFKLEEGTRTLTYTDDIAEWSYSATITFKKGS